MPKKLRWGVLSTSKFARTRVFPALRQTRHVELAAIASQDLGRASAMAAEFGVPTAYGSYEELLADKSIDAIYNPLPNHLHVPWSILAASAGKHVLCEKPIAMSTTELAELMHARDHARVKIGEAFMVATHPQWLKAREIVQSGRIGALRAVQGFFSYYNRDAKNIRNIHGFGGGAIMDIGCYPVFTSRFVVGQEPERVCSIIERDPDFGTDRLVSAMLDFGSVQASFVCSTQLVPYQRMNFFGTTGRVEVQIPFNAPPDRPTRILVDDGRDLFGGGVETEVVDTVDQYAVEFDAFSLAVLEDREVPVPLERSLGNMRVIDGLFQSAVSGGWVKI